MTTTAITVIIVKIINNNSGKNERDVRTGTALVN